jgi:tRNA threonylcarbamoyladenosine biosynthesis protein TsaB
MRTGFNCIAIETATSLCSVAACADERLEIIRLTDHRSSSRQLFKALGEVMERVGLVPEQLDCVAFGCGPGSFTGVRIAAAAAQGIAFAQSLPVCRVSTLAAMAAAAGPSARSRPVAVCLDARQGEIYLGLYGWDALGQPMALQPDALLQPEALMLDPVYGEVVAVGNGWSVWPDIQVRNKSLVGVSLPEVWPDALAVLAIARGQFARGEFVAPAEAIPNYVRNQVTY